MYTGYGFRDYEIGDVDVVKHEGVYHLFHLTLPNHDYIAHAVSEDGLTWTRVKNALFISDPRAWDDDMLWTMHVTPDPHNPGMWRMFYTGLCMRERGRIQRIGMARSSNLYDWEKDTSGNFPLTISNDHYESDLDVGRHWISFRDPFCYRENGSTYLLASGRVNYGPIIRRGCVVLCEETAVDQFKFHPPLFHPMRYDDIEVPNLVKIDGRYYLLGSIREDIKVHYWYADALRGPYQNFYDNVLLPQGNYAARIARDEDKWLIWNFFFKGLSTKGDHLLAPPKELAIDHNGELRLKSFSGFDDMIDSTHVISDLGPLHRLFKNSKAFSVVEGDVCRLGSHSGFEAFLLQGEYTDFMMSGDLYMEGNGKCGLVLRLDENGDGYYISLDLFKGIAQIRAWGHNANGGIEESFQYEQLQAAHYVPTAEETHHFRLIAFEQYIELSINGYILLTLAHDQFASGNVGFYVESSWLRLENIKLHTFQTEAMESYPESMANF